MRILEGRLVCVLGGVSALTDLSKLTFFFPYMYSASILSPISLLLTQDYTDGMGAKMELGIFVPLLLMELTGRNLF